MEPRNEQERYDAQQIRLDPVRASFAQDHYPEPTQSETHYVEWTRDGDSWIVGFFSKDAALRAIARANFADYQDGDSPLWGRYLGDRNPAQSCSREGAELVD